MPGLPVERKGSGVEAADGIVIQVGRQYDAAGDLVV
jgi:hypothetical protein